MELMLLWISKGLKMELLLDIFINCITGYTPVYILIILCISFFGADWELYNWSNQSVVARASSELHNIMNIAA